MAKTPRKATVVDAEGADTEAFKYAISQWGDKACVVKRMPAPPDRPNVVYEVGVLQGGVFSVFGCGATWTEAITDASQRNLLNMTHKYSREKS